MKITHWGPISSINKSPKVLLIQAFTFTKNCIALEDMNMSSWVANVPNAWNRVEECIDWCVPVFREVICIDISMWFTDRSMNHTTFSLISLLSHWHFLQRVIVDVSHRQWPFPLPTDNLNIAITSIGRLNKSWNVQRANIVGMIIFVFDFLNLNSVPQCAPMSWKPIICMWWPWRLNLVHHPAGKQLEVMGMS